MREEKITEEIFKMNVYPHMSLWAKCEYWYEKIYNVVKAFTLRILPRYRDSMQ